ncbi:MAG: sulfotransferase domain-containing protein [Actinomycetota bacterium]|nr:sulfotransferase domain-containing protein [Actinomycetota bacterium]
MSGGQRLPDFIIIGAMKSGTSSLYYWLSEQPGSWGNRQKEPNFFGTDENWNRGVDWYSNIFSLAPPEKLVGESSPAYSHPNLAPMAAMRMAAVVPRVKLIYVLRHPVERLRSHYRHNIRRGREPRPLVEAIAEPGNEYVGRSLYHFCLRPYAGLFPREQICVVRFEDMVSVGAPAWSTVLDHVGLPQRDRPAKAHNVTIEKPHYTALMYRLWESGHHKGLSRFPRPVRRIGKRLLVREGPEQVRRLRASEARIPEHIVQPIWDDIERLEEWLGVGQPLWVRSNEPASS